MKNHPLFPDHAETEIDGFHVTRHGTRGQEWAPPLYPADQITELAQIADLYGGGTYELMARGTIAGKADGKGKKGVVARVTYRLPGAEKPLVPETAAPVQESRAPAATTDTAAILQYMAQQSAQQMQLLGTMMTAVLSNQNRPSGDGGVTAAAIAALSDVVKTALSHTGPAAAASVDPMANMKTLMDLGDWISGIAHGARAAAAKTAAGEDPGLDLNAIAEFAEKAVGVVKKAKDLGEQGKSPAEAAEELAQAAAE